MAVFQPRFRQETIDEFLGYAQQQQQAQDNAMLDQTLRPGNWASYWGQHAGNTANQFSGYGPRQTPINSWGPQAQTSRDSWSQGLNPYSSGRLNPTSFGGQPAPAWALSSAYHQRQQQGPMSPRGFTGFSYSLY